MNDHWDDNDDDDIADDEQDESSETVACPACGADVYEDALRCPICGEFISQSTSALAGRPWWWIALGIAGVIAVILALVASSGF